MSDITPNVLKTLTDNGRQSIHIIYYQTIKAVTKKYKYLRCVLK